MKILIVTGLFYPARLGGPANTLYWLSKELARRGVEVYVVSTCHTIPVGEVAINKWVVKDEINVYYSSKRSPFGFRQLMAVLKLLKQIDCVMLSSFFYKPNLIACLLSLIYRKKVIWSPRGEFSDAAIEGSVLKRIYIRLIGKSIASYVIFHATSDDEKQSIEHYFPSSSKPILVPNYFQLPKLQKQSESTFPYLLYVGRIAPIKALDNLIHGFALSNLINLGYRLLLVGPDQENYKKYLKQLDINPAVWNNIEFKDSVFGDEKFKLYAGAKYFCLVSHSENFGNVVIEALSQGTPTIASRGTPWGILEESGAGMWIDNSVSNITKCFNTLAEIPDDIYLQMRRNAYEVARKYDISSNINKWIVIFNEILQRVDA